MQLMEILKDIDKQADDRTLAGAMVIAIASGSGVNLPTLGRSLQSSLKDRIAARRVAIEDYLTSLSKEENLNDREREVVNAYLKLQEVRLKASKMAEQASELRKNAQLSAAEKEELEAQARHSKLVEAALTRAGKTNDKLAQLVDERNALQEELDNALSGDGSTDRVKELQDGIKFANEEIGKIRVEGSLDQVKELLSEAQNLKTEISAMPDLEIPEIEGAQGDVEKLIEKLLKAVANGEDLNAVSLARLVNQLASVQSKAVDAASAIAAAFQAARDETSGVTNGDKLTRLKIKEQTVGKPVERAQRLAESDFRVKNRDLFEQGNNAQVTELDGLARKAGENAKKVEEASIRVQNAEKAWKKETKDKANGGSSAAKKHAKELEKLESQLERIVESQRTDAEREKAEMARLLVFRNKLIEAYGKESEQVEKLDTAIQRMNDKSAKAFEGVFKFFVAGVREGKKFDDILKDLILKMIELNGATALTNLFKGTNSGGAGGALGGFITDLFKFADGGIMTSQGSVPLKAYSNGGIANSPQLSLFGEGRTPEAYVPLPDGRTIPVTISGRDVQRWTNGRHERNQPSMVIDASMNVQIDGTDKTTEQIQSEMMPMFEQQQRVIIEQVKTLNEEDPTYIT